MASSLPSTELTKHVGGADHFATVQDALLGATVCLLCGEGEAEPLSEGSLAADVVGARLPRGIFVAPLCTAHRALVEESVAQSNGALPLRAS